MTTSANAPSSSSKTVRNVVIGVVFSAIVVLLMLYLSGRFAPKVGAEGPEGGQDAPPAFGAVLPPDARTAVAAFVEVPRVESAVGAVEAVHEASVASKILARVTEVSVRAGDEVSAGDVLVKLDDADLQARLKQAQAAVAAATARRDQAQIEFDRLEGLRKQGVATQLEFDRARTELAAAMAAVDQAEQTLSESRANLDYATVASPISGRVIDRLVEEGDMASPGQALISLYDPTHMQLVAQVRESLTHNLRVGQQVGVRIDALNRQCAGSISEIVPQAQSASRTFAVKVTGPCPPDVYSGMFGRLQIPLGMERVLVVPQAAVRQVGQLKLVDVVVDGRLQRRAVQLGQVVDERVEVLSGVDAGDVVVLHEGEAE